jgi:hypothetical protein
MRDTKQMENVAEDYVAHFLQRYDILVAKPKFDKEGADLLALLLANDGAQFCRIQSKGRSLKKDKSRSKVEIPRSYVSDFFIVMIYVDDGKSEHLYCCFGSDLKAEPWIKKDGQYILSFSKANFGERLKKFEVDEEGIVVERIKDVIRNADLAEVMAAIAKAQEFPTMENAIDVINAAGRRGGPRMVAEALARIQQPIKQGGKQSTE